MMMDALKEPNTRLINRYNSLCYSANWPEYHYYRWVLHPTPWVQREFKLRGFWEKWESTYYHSNQSAKMKMCLRAFVLNEKALTDGRCKRKAARATFGKQE